MKIYLPKKQREQISVDILNKYFYLSLSQNEVYNGLSQILNKFIEPSLKLDNRCSAETKKGRNLGKKLLTQVKDKIEEEQKIINNLIYNEEIKD